MSLNFDQIFARGKHIPLDLDHFGKRITGSLYLSAWSDRSAAFAVTIDNLYRGYLLYRFDTWSAEKIADEELVRALAQVAEKFYL